MSEMLKEQPETAGECTCWLPRHKKSVPTARGLLRDFLDDHNSTEPFGFTGELVLGELVTNAVQHARTPRDRLLYVRLALSADDLRLEVHDAGTQQPVLRHTNADEQCGRGLWLVSELALRWGCSPRPGGVGKAVWAVLGPQTGAAA
ncbi:ATP-binding protein [Kitasatospora sp. MAA19]|uniref:ATP-binding protein n=1 Tax=Kitasatospora sp. MAA19 TaxID=3035090 RepID=UPI002477299D|nr:ATP-binding protein [Kitasatospora sp. MAA19]